MLGEKGGRGHKLGGGGGGAARPHKLAPPPTPTTMQTSLNFRNFAELYPHLLKAYHFKI